MKPNEGEIISRNVQIRLEKSYYVYCTK